MKTQILFLMALLCAVVAGVHSAQANTITVTNRNDSGPGSLRHALKLAINGDTIDATGVVGRIVLTSGALQITHSVHINGPGAGNLAVDGNAISSVFENFASNVTISGFTITQANGGAIINQGGLTLRNSSVVSNAGGGIGNFTSNTSVPATLTITNCTVSGNSATNGGGIYNLGQIIATATVAISNSTLSGNSAFNGGAIFNDAVHFASASVSVKNCTISGNSAPNGGVYFSAGFVTLELGSTILNAGSSGKNISAGTVKSDGYNLASFNGGGFLKGPGDKINTNPMLGPLQHNGGPTFTQALLPGSPAIDAGDPNFTPPPFFDQRGPGHARVVNGRIDIGSFEVQ